MRAQAQEMDDNIYLYSSLSSISLKKELIEFYIAGGEDDHLIPLSVMSRYPGINTEVRSEYFDSTIWGQLGNYFNENIEVIALENKILAMLKEIEGINKKYSSAFNSRGFRFKKEQTVTLTQYNYFYDENKTETTKGNVALKGSSNHSSSKRASSGRPVLKNQSETFNSSALRLKSELLTKQVASYETAFIENKANISLKTHQVILSSKASGGSGWIGKLFVKIGQIYDYFIHNKLVFLFVVFLFVLFLKLLSALFSR